MKGIISKLLCDLSFRAGLWHSTVCILLLSGCGVDLTAPTTEREKPYEASVLDTLNGLSIEEVRHELGVPMFELEYQGKTYFIYQQTTNIAGAVIMLFPFPAWGTGLYCSWLEFDRNKRMTQYETDWFLVYPYNQDQYKYKTCRMLFWSDSRFAERETPAAIERRAHEGDPDAMYQYATKKHRKNGERFRWLCRAAHAGHAKAQWGLGQYYRRGFIVEEDLVLANVWYILSFEGGYAFAKRYTDWLSQEMTPAQIAEAERLVAKWESNPAECDEIVAQADK